MPTLVLDPYSNYFSHSILALHKTGSTAALFLETMSLVGNGRSIHHFFLFHGSCPHQAFPRKTLIPTVIESLSQLHERLIHSDTNQPRRELRVFEEVAHMFEGLQEDFLDCILRVFAVVRNVFRNPKEFAVITLHEFFKGRYISTLRGVDEIQVSPDHRALDELCDTRVHIVQGASAVVAYHLAFARVTAPRFFQSSWDEPNKNRDMSPPC